MANEFVIKNGFISQGDSLVNAILSANTIQILTAPTLNNSNTQILSRNSSTGAIEFSTLSAVTTDTFVTGFTYDNQNKLTLSQNQGQPDLIVYINQFSGLSINGLSLPSGYALSVTGDSIFNGDVYVNGDLNYNGNLIVTGSTIIENGLTANTIYTDYIDFNTNPTGVTTQFGRVNWDSGTGTLNIGIGDSTTGLIDFQVGQEEIVRVYNEEATTLQKGEIVYVYSSQGNRPSVKRAQAQGDLYSVTTLGMVDLPIAPGAQGYVTTFGIISNLNTLGLTGGTPIWLSPTTPGGYTSVKPKAPDHTILIGYVIRVSATVGSIFVNISNGWELDELHDVRISGATEGDLLMRSSYNGSPVWVNTKTLKGDYTINGELTVTGATNVSYIDFDTTLTGTTSTEGRLFWDVNNRTLSLGMTSGVTQQIGEEQYYLVEAFSNILDGRVVGAVGTTGASGKILADYMIADGSIPAVSTIGILTQNLNAGETGYVTNFGLVRGLDTTGVPYGETWSNGDFLYVSPYTGGTLTNIKPTAPNLEILVALVIYADASNGSIFVRPKIGESLETLYDTAISGLTNGDLLVYNSGTNLWENGKDLFGNYTIDGNLNVTSGITVNSLTANTINVTSIGVSGNCVTDIFVDNLYGCSPITFHDSIQSNGSSANGITSLAFGDSVSALSDYSQAGGQSTTTGLNTAFSGSVSNGLITLNSSYNDASGYFTQNGLLYLYDEPFDNIYGRTIFTISASTFDGVNTLVQLEDITVTTSTVYVIDTIGTNYWVGDSFIPAPHSNVEGGSSKTIGNYSHAEGLDGISIGNYSHAEGRSTMSIGSNSHAEGFSTKSIGTYSHAEGYYTKSIGDNSHSQGGNTVSLGQYSFASGYGSISSGDTSFVHSTNSIAIGNRSVVLGGQNITGYTDDTVYVPNLNVQGYIDFDITQTGTTSSPGRLFWDVSNRTLSLGMIGGVTQQIGEEQYFLVENQTTGTLNDGTVVRAVGTNGNDGKILVDAMIANGTIPAFTTIGVLTQPLLSGETGYVTNFGLVRGLDTSGSIYGETWFDGTILYVSPTNLGGFTSVKPITPNQDIIIAIVMKAGTGTTGSIFVRPDVYRPFKDPNLITVAKQNGDFTSIRDAVNSLSGLTSSSNRYVIEVGPGIFTEGEIDMTSTPYVSMVGSNIQTTLIVPSGSTQHVIKIGQNNEISFLSISGAPFGYAAIYAYDIGDFGQAHKISMYDCDIGVWVESDTQDTVFFGEYIDMNGEFSYGTKIIANNGFVSSVNMENYYLFPTGSGIQIGNRIFGTGSTLNMTASSLGGNLFTGSTGIEMEDTAFLNMAATDIFDWGDGLKIINNGGPSSFEINGSTFTNNLLLDINVEQSTATGVFLGISSHEKVVTASPNVYWSFLDSDDGELDITRKGSVTFPDGSHTDFTTLIFEGSSMGLMSGGSITTISGTTVEAIAGFGYVEKSDNSGIIRRIDWANNQVVLSPNSDLYISIDENGNINSSASRPNSFYNIILGRVVTNTTDVEFIDLSPFNAEHTSNRYDNLFTEAMGPIYAFGSIVTEGTTPFTLDVTAGDYYYSTNKFLPSGGNGITFVQYYRAGTGSTWVTSATTIVNNTQYDSNGVLSALTTGYYTKHTLYTIGDGSYEHYFLVLGQNQYGTLVEAEGAGLPTPPTYFSDGVTQIANIYIKQGSSGFTQVEDIRPTIGFRAGGVNASSVHGNLLGLSSDDHQQYLLVNGVRAMIGDLNMGTSYSITNVNLVDGVDVSDHKTRHQFGGSDPVGSSTPLANAIPYANSNGLLDSWISTATTTTLGKVTLSTTPLSASNPIAVGSNDLRLLKAVTGGTFSNITNTLTLTTNDGSLVDISGFTSTDFFVTGGTFNSGTNTLTLNRQNGSVVVTGFTSSSSGDNYVTGGTYSSGALTLDRQNGSVSITGFTTGIKAGTVAGASFSGNPKKITVTFTSAYPNTNYSITITGNVNRSFTWESKATTGFTINSNANTSFTEDVNWVTMSYGEF